MLNLWIGDRDFPVQVLNPDLYFNEFIDKHCIETDFGKRVVKECSDVKEVINYVNMVLPNGELISPNELSSGAKNLLIMMYDDEAVCDMEWCGNNCDHFIGEIAKAKDFTLQTTRWYVPFKNAEFPDGVRILNIDKVVYDIDEFLGAVVENELNELLY